ncbi:MAG: DUF2142 domain-containing protein [Actinomycetota bacterium]|nr:DUF2142 domain-containing protein [Actinomycetota bacterium]
MSDLAASRPPARRIAIHPLAALLVAMTVLGVTWALLVPPWQTPDENWHYAYAQSLAESFALPGNAARAGYSSDLALALRADNTLPLIFHPQQVTPAWSHVAEQRYLRQAARNPSRSDGGGGNTAQANPPLFYLYDDLPYWLSSSGTAFARLYAMRVFNVTLLLTTVAAAWLLAGELFHRRRLIQLLCAGSVGLLPMQTFILTSVNPDAMEVALWTLVLWMGVRVIKRAGRASDAAVLCALTAAAILTKATGYALIPATLTALALGLWRREPAQRAAVARRLAGAALALVLPVLGWLAVARALSRPAINPVVPLAPGVRPQPFQVAHFVSYLVHFYIPHRAALGGLTSLPLYATWVRGGWGLFGWQDVALPPLTYKLAAGAMAIVAIAALGALVRIRDRRTLELLAFLALPLLALLGLLHISDYRSLLVGNGGLLQGRYLLPVSSLLGVALAAVATRLPPRWRAGFAAATLGALLILQVLALATVARSYYT